MKDKTFDCVEMKRRGAKLVYEEVKGMTTEQELEYWKTVTAGLKARQKAARTKRRRSV
jgi:hypothetical protein